MPNVEFLAGGKVKDIYKIDDEYLLFRFSNRVSAYDVKFAQEIPHKGRTLCKFAELWFEHLEVPNHFVRRESDTDIIVRRMHMLPIECVVRGYLYGSLYDRYKAGRIRLPDDTDTALASQLPRPVFDPTTKSEHDIPVNREDAISMKLVTSDQYDWLESTSMSIYETMSKIADTAGFILADLKLEFGMINGRIILGDSIGPDEYRMWPKDTYEPGRTQNSYDKQILRDWLADNGYKQGFEDERRVNREPKAPQIPQHVIDKMTRRYVDSFETISNALA